MARRYCFSLGVRRSNLTWKKFLSSCRMTAPRELSTSACAIGAFAAWFIILFTGKLPRGLFDLMVLANSYTARSDAYLFLLTETYPPFQDEQTRAAGIA